MSRPSYVYLLSDSSGHVKIGVTADVSRRYSQLAVGNPTLRLIGYSRPMSRQDALRYEKKYHRKFEKQNVGGEWFDLNMKQINTTYSELSRSQKGEGSLLRLTAKAMYILTVIICLPLLWLTEGLVDGAFRKGFWKVSGSFILTGIYMGLIKSIVESDIFWLIAYLALAYSFIFVFYWILAGVNIYIWAYKEYRKQQEEIKERKEKTMEALKDL